MLSKQGVQLQLSIVLIIKDATGNTVTVISASQALTLGTLTTITGSYTVPSTGSTL